MSSFPTQAPPNSTYYFCLYLASIPLYLPLHACTSAPLQPYRLPHTTPASTALHYTGIRAHTRLLLPYALLSAPIFLRTSSILTTLLHFFHSSSLFVASPLSHSHTILCLNSNSHPQTVYLSLSLLCLPYTALLRGLCIFRHACCASASIECWPARPTHTLSLCFGLCLMPCVLCLVHFSLLLLDSELPQKLTAISAQYYSVQHKALLLAFLGNNIPTPPPPILSQRPTPPPEAEQQVCHLSSTNDSSR